MSSKQALNHAVPILLCMLVGISAVRYLDDQRVIAWLLIGFAVAGVTFGAWKLLRGAPSDDASSSAWPFFFLANVIDGFFGRGGLAGQAVGAVAALALAVLAAIRIRHILGRKIADPATSGTKG